MKKHRWQEGRILYEVLSCGFNFLTAVRGCLLKDTDGMLGEGGTLDLRGKYVSLK